jgi:LmbE family N-acetylglucosaminyl deacetylase
MAVMAHPDDAEIWCGGTLIQRAEKGDDIRICTLSYTEDSKRGMEGKESAKQMGCEVKFLGVEDTNIRDTKEAVRWLSQSIESFQPDIIITHWYDDMHPDHEATFCIVRRALLQAYVNSSPAKQRMLPRIFCCDSLSSNGLHGPFKPDKYIDVTAIWDKKIAAIQIHQSQPLSFYLEMINKQCLAHGKESGTKRAEGFLYLPIFGFPDTGQSLVG